MQNNNVLKTGLHGQQCLAFASVIHNLVMCARMYASILHPQLISSLAKKSHSAAVATRGGHYGCRWVSVVITAKLKAKDRRLPHGRGAEGQIGSGQVQRSQGNNQGIPAALRCSILVTAIWALLLRSLQSRLYPTKVCQHSPPRSEKTSQNQLW